MATIEAKHNEDYVVVATNSFATDGITASEFFTKSGWLSGYALGMGYVESASGVKLYRTGDEFTVREGDKVESFMSLNLARKEFVRRVKDKLRRELREMAGTELA